LKSDISHLTSETSGEESVSQAPSSASDVRFQMSASRFQDFDLLPPWPEDLLPSIRERVAASRRTVVVLDDDPTGTQTVYDTPVLTVWGVETLAAEFRAGTALFYILTNSRSLAPAAAAELNREIAENLLQAAQIAGRGVERVGSSDGGVTCVSPHPDPLPEERERPTDRALSERVPGTGGRTSSLPLPKGEGRGEGEGDVRGLAVLPRSSTASQGHRFTVISRSDSTLRGHYPVEVDVLAEVLGLRDAVQLICPFFEEGGRFTIDDVHYVAEGDRLVPTAETPFARDASFGYTKSNLREWVEEKTGGRVQASAVASLSLDTIRGGGPQAVTGQLLSLEPGSVCVINAVTMRDLEVVVAGLLEAEEQGRTFLARTAASFVRARAGLEKQPLLGAAASQPPMAGGRNAAIPATGGLVVVGSYVPKTTEQLTHLLEHGRIERIELCVEQLLDAVARAKAIEGTLSVLDAHLAGGHDVVLFTSRKLVTGRDAAQSLAIGSQVSAALVEIVQRLRTPPRFLIAKGGITSSDVATQALGVKRALVLGQILPGVPVWKLGDESRFPGLNYIVFPGNVGGRDALTEVIGRAASQPPNRTEPAYGGKDAAVPRDAQPGRLGSHPSEA
jgi:uncharacterized protein YgbK (DUF1537 family)